MSRDEWLVPPQAPTDCWNREEMLDAVARYEQQLRDAGRTAGTIATYVGDARRFLDWLTGGSSGGAGRRRRSLPSPRSPAGSEAGPAAVDELRRLHATWTAAGRPIQPPIFWPRDRWILGLPQYRDLFASLPARLDRPAVRRVGRDAARDTHHAVSAFLASLAWGFGSVGYGPFRAAHMLQETPDAPQRLLGVARAIREHGPVAAYARLSAEARINRLGPAFGTKYLAFIQEPAARPTALIHDELVSEWLRLHGYARLASRTWSIGKYEAYLQQMQAWADELNADPETVEYLIFRSMSDERGNQWSR
jgi:hypothetical protein